MTVRYLETSALLTWLFNEAAAQEVVDAINEADLICTSELIRIETHRAIRRAFREEMITADQYKDLKRLFEEKLRGWFRMSIDESVVYGSSVDFPLEPVRTLDAIHLATALEYKKLYPEIEMITRDDRILRNRRALAL
ncbi:MAG: type II toxin-antitoxin system VapC family toxin [Spirochaetales bacterium]|jgi:predicted nucleic acid-binding protein|nr:type II toxin-antitoxin system VapC family toxin [Spirochaetales bacterium]